MFSWLLQFLKDLVSVVNLIFQLLQLYKPTVNSLPTSWCSILGHEVDDNHIWYFNGTPASSAVFGINYVIPKYGDNVTIDLVVSGPNEGTNMSPGLFTISGTVGATYTSIYRGIPGVASLVQTPTTPSSKIAWI